MFAWNKPYEEMAKMEKLFDDILVFPSNINAWTFPLVYDVQTQSIFLAMSEGNVNQKRKQKVSEEHPPHYSKILCEINQPYSNQVSLFEQQTQNPVNILKRFTSDPRINELPQDIKLVIVSGHTIQGELVKVSGALFDKNLQLIDNEVDWSSYIDTSYDSNSILNDKAEEQISKTNTNTEIMNTLKENLVSIKVDTISSLSEI